MRGLPAWDAASRAAAALAAAGCLALALAAQRLCDETVSGSHPAAGAASPRGLPGPIRADSRTDSLHARNPFRPGRRTGTGAQRITYVADAVTREVEPGSQHQQRGSPLAERTNPIQPRRTW